MTRLPTLPLSATDMRDAFFGALYEIARLDPAVVLLSNDFGAPSLDRFRIDCASQFVNAAISEQNMMSMAAGMSMAGRKPIVYSIASFLTLRALEQVKVDICSMKARVMLLGVGCGYAYSYDGPTHHATEDIAIMRALSGMSIWSPSDPRTAAALAPMIHDLSGPTYLRFDRGNWPEYDSAPLADGCRHLRQGKDVAIISTGSMVHRAVDMAERLAASNVQASVIDLFRLKPVNVDAFLHALGDSRAIATVEEQGISGGFGGLVAETLADAGILRPLKRFAIPDHQVFAYGDRAALHEQRGLDTVSAVAALTEWLGRL